MFDFVRTHQKLMQIILALLIVPSFVLVGGVGGAKLFGEDPNTIAKVAGFPLTQQEWENAQRRQLETMRQQYGKQFDQKLIDTPEFRQQVLDQLIAQRAIDAEIRNAHLAVSEQKVQSEVANQFPFFKADRSFDTAQYVKALDNMGMNANMHQKQIRDQLTQAQLALGVGASAFAPRAVSKALSDFTAQEREVQEMAIPVTQFLPNVKVTDEMVKAFYDKNSKLFEIPESAKIEYVVLNAEAAAAQVNVSDDEIAAYYKSNEKRFTEGETRRAAHILIEAGSDKAAAKAKAEAVLAEVRKNPADFAKIAKTKSDDVGTADKGGDLGLIVENKDNSPADAAALKLKQGEISGLVESSFGYHIVTVTELKPARIKALDEVKGDVAAEIKKAKAGKLFAEMSEQFTDIVYSQYESLKPAADKLKLKVETVEGLGRLPNPILGAAPFNNAKFLGALFSDDSLKNKRNTEAVEVAPQTVIAGRIVEFKPTAKKPLAEVEAAIKQSVALEEAMKEAKKTGEEKLAAAKKAGDAAGFGEAKMVSHTKADGINPAAARAVMKADVSKLPAYVGVEIPGGGYGVYRIGKVGQPAEEDKNRREQEAQGISQMIAQQEMAGYIETLKHKAKVRIIRPLASIKKDVE